MAQSAATAKRRVIVLGTGGTIAGRAATARDNIGYTAAELGVADLLAGIDAPADVALEAEQVAQVDSKDMTHEIWRTLARRCMHWLSQPDVAALVITHGTDTLEETAFFLHAVLAPAKPVVLTCAMRPATALAPDGPQNLRDAIVVAATPGARGVSAVCAGKVHGALDVQKIHSYQLDAFSSGDAGPIGYVEEGAVRLSRSWPEADDKAARGAAALVAEHAQWPRVEIVLSHAGAGGGVIDALMLQREDAQAQPLRGLVLAATGNGTLHEALEAAALRAQADGVMVRRATRCVNGRILPRPDDRIADAAALSPVKARIALMLELAGLGTAA